jgi:hypothetical protein
MSLAEVEAIPGGPPGDYRTVPTRYLDSDGNFSMDGTIRLAATEGNAPLLAYRIRPAAVSRRAHIVQLLDDGRRTGWPNGDLRIVLRADGIA